MNALLPLCKSSLTDDEKISLLASVLTAHAKSARNNDCISNMAIRLSAAGSGDFCKSVSCAVNTLGGRHGALAQARKLLREDNSLLFGLIEHGAIIPGFGNSFFQTSIDPAWEEVAYLLRTQFHAVHEKLTLITEEFAKHNKRLYPNPAAFTAVVSELLGMDEGTEILLLIYARLPIWAELFHMEHSSHKQVHEP